MKRSMVVKISAAVVVAAAAITAAVFVLSGEDKPAQEQGIAQKSELVEITDSYVGEKSDLAEDFSDGNFRINDTATVTVSYLGSSEAPLTVPVGFYNDVISGLDFAPFSGSYTSLENEEPAFTISAMSGGDTLSAELYYAKLLLRAGDEVFSCEISDEERTRIATLMMENIAIYEFLPAAEKSTVKTDGAAAEYIAAESEDGEFYRSFLVEAKDGGASCVAAADGGALAYLESPLDGTDSGYFQAYVEKGGVGYRMMNDGSYERDALPTSMVDVYFTNVVCSEGNFLGGYTLSMSGEDHILEKYSDGCNIVLVVSNGEGVPTAALLYNGYNVYRLIEFAFSQPEGQLGAEELSELFEAAKRDSDDSELTEITEDITFNAEGRFDFAADRKHIEDIENPGIVDSYREFFKKSEEFTVHITTKRDDYLTSAFVTCSADGYYEMRISKNGSEPPLYNENVYLNGSDVYFSRCYDEEAPQEFTAYQSYDGMGAYVMSIIQERKRDDDARFVKAYKAEVGGEEYICEVWHTGVVDYTFFCRDGEIVAYEVPLAMGVEFGVIESLSDQAESDYIALPEAYLNQVD